MELLERFLGSDDDESDADGGDDDMFFEEEDDLDDFGGDDFGDDGLGFDDGDDGGAATAELEGRIDEMENEVASLSSTVSTIRSENEEISNTVEDVEENVRKLLDIYEMVTRGVNPFVDDVQAGGGGFDGGGGSLGLFDDDEDEDAEELDDDIAGAEAEDFFDDDFLDDEDGDEDDFGDLGGAIDDDPTTEDTMADDDSDDSGKSFEELKDEYNSGEADWADDDGDATNGDTADDFDEGAEDDGDDFGDLGDDGDDFGDLGDGGGFGDPPTTDDDSTPEAMATDGAAATPTPEGTGAGDLQFAANTVMQGSGTSKPYLETVPSGYVGDLLVMEWLEYLVEEGDVEDAARAVEYYRRIQWIGEGAADELRDFLVGFGDLDADREVTGAPSTLSIDHHVASLRYISRLTGSTADSVVFDCWSGGGGVPFGL